MSVNIPLSVIARILCPPPDIVHPGQDYLQYVSRLFDAVESSQPADRYFKDKGAPVGRPLKAQHPCYSDAELKAIRNYLLEEFKAQPQGWNNGAQGKPHGLLVTQPDDETRFYLDNGLTAVFAERVPVIDGVAQPSFPPGVENE